MISDGEPTRKLGRHVATRSEDTDRIRIGEGAGHEIETRDVQTPPNFVRVPNDRIRFEAPKRKVEDYYNLNNVLRHVVGPVVKAKRAQ